MIGELRVMAVDKPVGERWTKISADLGLRRPQEEE